MLYLHVYVCIVHTVYEHALLNTGLHSSIVLRSPAKYNYEALGLGACGCRVDLIDQDHDRMTINKSSL